MFTSAVRIGALVAAARALNCLISARKSHSEYRKNPSLIVGLGMACMDLIAEVKAFPSPDDKIRTTRLTSCGGGNASNTLCGLARLGNRVRMVSKVGSDAYGGRVVKEMDTFGVDCAHVVRSMHTNTATTYVLVDTHAGTRACIHTPAAALLRPGEVDRAVLRGASWLHLDARHTLAAISLADEAIQRGIPVSVDAERPRANLIALLGRASLVFASKAFALKYADRTDAAASKMFAEFNRCRLIVITDGKRGAHLYTHGLASPGSCFWCPAAPVPEKDVVDTTGAGDAFIAGFLHRITQHTQKSGGNRISFADDVLCAALRTGTVLAACKITASGAREGLPTPRQLSAALKRFALRVSVC